MSRGRAVRARRRIPRLAGALAVAAGTALAVTTLLPGSDQAAQQPSAQLAAWTVTKQTDGTVGNVAHGTVERGPVYSSPQCTG